MINRRRRALLLAGVGVLSVGFPPWVQAADIPPPGGAFSPRTPCAGETDRAERTADRLNRSWPLRGSSPLLDVVRAIGAELAAHAPPPSEWWRFVLVDDSGENAFSIGAGRIYVTRGAITACRSEAELAALIAHEMAHELLGHFCTPRSRGERRSIGDVTQRIDPPLERAADAGSIPLLLAAGYDPHAALAVVRRAERDSPGFDPSRLPALEKRLDGVPTGGRGDSDAFIKLTRPATPRSRGRSKKTGR